MEKLRHQYPADALAEALEVSESGFHAHRRKPRRPRRQRDAQLRPLIAGSFAHSRRTYGSPRVRADLRELGRALRQEPHRPAHAREGLRPTQKRRFRPSTTDSRHPHKVAENWLAKVPAPDRPGRSGRATSPTSRPAKAGSTWPSPSMPARAAASPTTAARTCAPS